jgi:hypothetical protein
MPTYGELIADRLIGLARDLCGALDRAAQVADAPVHPKRFLVAWADSQPMVVGLSRILAWWPEHPEIRARLLQLQLGEAWTDPELKPDGTPLCAVIRLE